MSHHIYKLILVIHIVGITMMAGTTFIDFRIFNEFWKTYPKDRSQSLVLESMVNRLQKFMGIGMLLIILSGVGMMYYLHQVWGQQIWFRIKMIILLLIIVNGLGFRRMAGLKLKRILTGGLTEGHEQLSMLKGRISLIHYFQMAFFIVIFFLSVFKFN